MKPYEKYKNSGIEWLGEIPEHWRPIKLKFNSTTKFSSVDRHEFEDELSVSICHYPDAYNNQKINKSSKLSKGTCNAKEFENYSLAKGQVIITKDSESANDIGIPTFIEEDIPNSVCGYHLAIIESDSNKLISNFLFRFIQSSQVKAYFETNSNGVTRFGLGKSTIECLTVPHPPIHEQTQIAKYLDHQTSIIDELIAQKEQLITLLKQKRQTVINEAVTKGLNPNAKMKDSGIEWLGQVPENWKLVKFKYIAKIRNGKDQKPVEIEEGGYPVLGTGGEFGRASEYLYDKPSVLLGRKGTIDKPQYVEEPFWTVDTLFYTEIRENCIPLFVFYLCQQIPFQLLQESSAVPSMTQDNLNNVFLCKPSLEEQNEICSYLQKKTNDFDILIEKSTKQIENLKEYRQSLISEAVTGKIDLRDWQPNE
ncbi:restriction endonuclease subunit S [Acetobacteroides hydrogenigenes]|uniref:Type I restriction enzyme S subunit n=1 Tax=Acetobacteroides hydrogenigenes TaxID=979970 RepID=A0A4R2E4U9_9BACT|nr:restriction endonuclease subunit S [Acetobacteroides hydrogenigenes]TCN61636.1 type I restriction enzyme S subunit [Acetobacteroides hydrogenigenes]